MLREIMVALKRYEILKEKKEKMKEMSDIKQVEEASQMSKTIPEVPDCFKSKEELEKASKEQVEYVSESMKCNNGRVEEFFLQDLQPDTQRLEIEEVARVIITPLGVEVYTFDDMVYMIEIGGTKIRQMEWKEKENSEPELEEKCTKVMTVKQ